MFSVVRSVWIWTASFVLIGVWFPMLAVITLFDRDPVRRTTGRWFRRLGVAMTKINPGWTFNVSGHSIHDLNDGYIVVSNHQSFADIPFISRLPWEMKWMAKEELFRLPLVGWMMRMAGDIPIKRGSISSSRRAFERARWYLENDCPVIIFPEGTRSRNGRVLRFADGAFHLAIQTGVPIIPLVIDGTHDCLPRDSWTFGGSNDIRLHLLKPVTTEGRSPDESGILRDQIRDRMVEQLATMRNTDPEEVDYRSPATA